MARWTSRLGLGMAGLLVAAIGAPAEAVEYKLEVANLWETALYSYAKIAELYDGASGPGLDRLEASLDQGEMPESVTLGDRTLHWASESIAHAYGTVKVLAEIKPAARVGSAGTRCGGKASRAIAASGWWPRAGGHGRSWCTAWPSRATARCVTSSRTCRRTDTGARL